MSEIPMKDEYVKGTLENIPFPKVLNFINQSQKSGILAMSHGKKKVHIHFDRGEIVYVTSSYFPDLTLGDHLVKDSKITIQVQEESVDKAREEKIKQGAYLVEKGYLSPHDLYDALNKQVTEKLYVLYTWSEGEFYFREGDIIDEEHRILNISFPNLLYCGIRSYYPMNRPPIEFRGRKEGRLVKRMAGRYKIEDLRLGPAEMRIYNLVNGEHTLRQIISLANMSKRAAYKVIYGLFLLELLGFPEAGKSDEYKMAAQKAKKTKKKKAGYELAVPEDLLSQAVASVDRIKEEVQLELTDEIGVELEDRSRGAQRDEGSEFTSRVDEALDGDVGEIDYTTDDFIEEDATGTADAEPSEQAPEEELFGTKEGETREADEAVEEEYGWSETTFADEEALGEGAGPEEPEGFFVDIEDYTNAEELIKQADYLIDENRWAEAKQFLNKSTSLNESKAEAFALLGWVIFNENPTEEGVKEAEEVIRKGISIDAKVYLHYLYLGKIYSAMEQIEFAELHFVKALELNVECSEAKEEIKRLYNR